MRPHLSLAESCEISFYTFIQLHERRIRGGELCAALGVLQIYLSYLFYPPVLQRPSRSEKQVLLYSIVIGVFFKIYIDHFASFLYSPGGVV